MSSVRILRRADTRVLKREQDDSLGVHKHLESVQKIGIRQTFFNADFLASMYSEMTLEPTCLTLRYCFRS